MIRIFLSPLFILIFGGCGKFELSPEIGSDLPYFRESSSLSFLPEKDQVKSDCHSKGEICIFLKNPAAQEKKLIAPESSTELRQAQKFSAHLTGLDRSGFVKNQNLDIMNVNGERLKIQEALDSKGVDLNHARYLNAYYWLNRAWEHLKNRIGELPGHGHSLKVYVNDSYDGWVWNHRSLHLDEKSQTALSGEVVLLLFAEAQAGFASQGEIYKHSFSTHQSCQGDAVGCCRSSSGCSKAILRGVADSFVSFLFEDHLGIGEFHLQNLNGQGVCGKSRSPADFRDTSFQQAHNLCPEKVGSTLALGMVYSSVWFEARKKSSDPLKVEKVFFKHLYKLNGEDDFQTAQQKIIESCGELGFDDLIPLFQSEFSKR